MMKNMRRLLLLIALFWTTLLSAQQAQKDVIFLKDGTAYWGQIITIEKGRRVFIRLSGSDDIISVNYQEIEKMEVGQEPPKEATAQGQRPNLKKTKAQAEPKIKGPKTYAFSEKGVYHATYLGASFAKSTDETTLGLAFHHISGYQFNRMLGLGLGSGLDAYSLNRNESIVPLFIEARGYFNKKSVAPFYSFATGYGFALKNANEGINDAKGGWLVHPAVGIRLGAEKGLNATLDIGYRFQKAKFFRTFVFNGDTEVRDVIYQRLMLRMGIVF